MKFLKSQYCNFEFYVENYISLRIGGILAPFIIGIKPVSVPLFIMGMSCLVGGIIAVFLPETLGAPLPETLEDVRYELHPTT